MFKWGVSEELIGVDVYEALRTMNGLRAGGTEYGKPKRSTVTPEQFDTTLPCKPSVVRAMTLFQFLTGCRPDEVCRVRPIDIDRQDESCWLYRPGSDHRPNGQHKTAKRACDKAFPLPEQLAPRRQEDGRLESRAVWWARLTPADRDEVRAWRRSHRWSPDQLRHSRATELRCYGLDLTKTILGQTKVETTQLYAEKDLAAAMELVARIG